MDHWEEVYNSISQFISSLSFNFHVLQRMSIVSEYLDEHKEVLHRDNSGHNESWLANEHMMKFIGRWRMYVPRVNRSGKSSNAKKGKQPL
jgi:hypothetical protein